MERPQFPAHFPDGEIPVGRGRALDRLKQSAVSFPVMAEGLPERRPQLQSKLVVRVEPGEGCLLQGRELLDGGLRLPDRAP